MSKLDACLRDHQKSRLARDALRLCIAPHDSPPPRPTVWTVRTALCMRRQTLVVPVVCEMCPNLGGGAEKPSRPRCVALVHSPA